MSEINEFKSNKNIEKFLQSVDIVKIISKVINLKKSGRNYLGLCPFHPDKSPSMSVSKDLQIFKCFSCGAGGNVIKFVKDYYKLNFPDTLKKIIELGDLNNEKFPFILDWKPNNKEIKTKTYLEILHFITELYSYQLKQQIKNKNSLTFQFLKNRKISIDLIKTFKLGTSEGLENFITILKDNKNYGFNDLLEIGVIKSIVNDNQNLKFLPTLSNRMIFPIINVNNEIIALAGRNLENNSNIKYLNTKNSQIFTKGSHFFNEICLNLPNLNKNNNIYIVEGYIDVITLYFLGYKKSLGTLGLLLTNEQVQLLKKYNYINQIILIPDTDSPGFKGCLKNLSVLFKNEIYNIKGIILNGYKDINEFYCNFNSEKNIAKYKEYLETNTLNLFTFIDRLINKTDLKNNAQNEFFKILNFINDKIIQNNLLNQFAFHYKISYNELLKIFSATQLDAIYLEDYLNQEKLNQDEAFPLNSYENIEFNILKNLINFKYLRNIFLSFSCDFKIPLFKKVLISLLFFKDEETLKLLKKAIYSNENYKLVPLLNELLQIYESNLLSCNDKKEKKNICEIDLKNFVLKHSILNYTNIVNQIIKDIKLSDDDQEKNRLIIKKIQQEKILSKLKYLLKNKK